MNKTDKAQMFLTYWRMFARRAPEPQAEYPFSRAMGNRHCFDWAWDDKRIAVEVDGGQWAPGGGRHARDTDRVKGNLAVKLGWRVFHFSPEMLTADPEGCVKMVVDTLIAEAK